eukprot:Phypoly_transcript_09780.p1 GENE.Phypoly_transcript_09780~~Phypoly_transcript_09780.p1  ORF type:complete len:286 (+),score=16.56 Phypoly_transcript_09780:480-1337(+)
MGGPCENGPPRTPDDFAGVLVDMSALGIVYGVFNIVGSGISTIPQHIKIWQTRSGAGVSFMWIFIGSVTIFSATLNAVVLKFPQEHACYVLGVNRCLPSLLALIQLAILFIFTFPIFIWCLRFMDPTISRTARITGWALFFIFLLYMLISTGIAFLIIHLRGECSTAALTYGNVLGYLSTVLTFVHWSPQLYTTWKRKSVGSFSIIMLCLQVPGAIAIVVFQIFISKEQISTWMSFLCALIQQTILLIMLLYYRKADKTGTPDEKSVLLHNVDSEKQQRSKKLCG